MKPIKVIEKHLQKIKEIMVREGIPAIGVDGVCPECGEHFQAALFVEHPNTETTECAGARQVH